MCNYLQAGKITDSIGDSIHLHLDHSNGPEDRDRRNLEDSRRTGIDMDRKANLVLIPEANPTNRTGDRWGIVELEVRVRTCRAVRT